MWCPSPEPDGGFRASLLIGADNTASIALVDDTTDLGGVYNAIAGNQMLLVDGRNVGSSGDDNSRTAIGISEDGRYLIWLAIDGEQPGFSVGCDLMETAEWLRDFGAHNAINLDGGGSTTLVVRTPQGNADLVNYPDMGFQRVVGNHLGVFVEDVGGPPGQEDRPGGCAVTGSESQPGSGVFLAFLALVGILRPRQRLLLQRLLAVLRTHPPRRSRRT